MCNWCESEECHREVNDPSINTTNHALPQCRAQIVLLNELKKNALLITLYKFPLRSTTAAQSGDENQACLRAVVGLMACPEYADF